MCLLLLFFLIIDFLIISFAYGSGFNYDISFYLLIINIPLVIMSMFRHGKEFRVPLIISYLIRNILMYIDIYGSQYISLPSSGGDTENFYNAGLMYGRGVKILGGNLYGELYSKVIGVIFRIIGNERIFVQYINLILSIMTILILIKILKKLNIDYYVQRKVIWVISLGPMNLILSVLLLRESIVLFLITFSIYLYIRYIYDKSTLCFLVSIALIIISSMFHSGMIMNLVGILFYIVFYNKSESKIISKTIIFIVMFYAIVTFRYSIFDKFILQKKLLETNTDYITEAGSRYLPTIYINNFEKILKYGWLKAIYFLASPTPLYWRGGADLVTFTSDSLIYLYLLINILKNKINSDDKLEIVYKSLLLSLLALIFTFGIGTSAAGTAMRHRNKLITIFLILYSIVESNKFKNIEIISNKVKNHNLM